MEREYLDLNTAPGPNAVLWMRIAIASIVLIVILNHTEGSGMMQFSLGALTCLAVKKWLFVPATPPPYPSF